MSSYADAIGLILELALLALALLIVLVTLIAVWGRSR
jgi:hypothetical protein